MENTNQYQPYCIFMNSTGDITISWDAANEKDMLALIEKKMASGYTFFILRPSVLGALGLKTAATSIEQVRKAGSVIAPDALAQAVVMNLGDPDLSAAVASGKVSLLPSAKKSDMETVRRGATAKEIVKNQSVAIRAVVGG